MAQPTHLDQATKQALDEQPSVSAKIRYLCEKGYTRAETARILGKRYQHVKNVMDQSLSKKQNYIKDGSSSDAEKNKNIHASDYLSEDAVKEILYKWLEGQGWSVEIAWGQVRGPDCIAKRQGERWLIEVKGCGSRQPMRVNYFLAVFGELLQRMDEPDTFYSIALPDLNQFRGLWERLPNLAKERTKIWFITVFRETRHGF